MAELSYDQINGLYKQYLGRDASQDEYSNWVGGNYGATDLQGITGQISTSGEAQDYAQKNPATATAPTLSKEGAPAYPEYPVNVGAAAPVTAAPAASTSTAPATSGTASASQPGFAGFDASRIDSNTLKYNAMKVLQGLDPNDPASIQKAYTTLNAQAPGQYQLDKDGNLMLTGTADGYIGARPVGWGSGGAWYEPSAGKYNWQWLAYNEAHPGPNGETGAAASAGDTKSQVAQTGTNTAAHTNAAGNYTSGSFTDPTSYTYTQTGAPELPTLGTAPNLPTSLGTRPDLPTLGARPGLPTLASRPGLPTLGTRPDLATLTDYAPERSTLFDATNPNAQGINSLLDTLMQRSNQSLQINGNDPIIKNQVDAQDAQSQLSQRNYLSGVAERVGSNANISAEARAAAESGRRDTNAFQAQLMGNELAARRKEIQDALTERADLLTADQRARLEEELNRTKLAEDAWSSGQNRLVTLSGQRQAGFDTDTANQLELSRQGQSGYNADAANQLELSRQGQAGYSTDAGNLLELSRQGQAGYSTDATNQLELARLAQSGFNSTEDRRVLLAQLRQQGWSATEANRLAELLARRSLAQQAYQYDTTQNYLNSPLNG